MLCLLTCSSIDPRPSESHGIRCGILEGVVAIQTCSADIGVVRSFDSLSLLVCNAATQSRPDVIDKNLAECFISHFSSINSVYAFDSNCVISKSYANGQIAWVGKITNEVLMGQAKMGEYSTIKNTPQQNLDSVLESYYPEVFKGYNGQVLYYRLSNGEYDVDLDLYPGNMDIEYIQIYASTQNELDNETFLQRNTITRYATNVENNGYFDPVLE